MHERERVISVTLTEAEWRAFIARQPQPVRWLRERIYEAINLSEPDAPGAGAGETVDRR